MTQTNGPGCQKHEKAVYESVRYAGKHDTVEFRIAMSDARQKDMLDG